MPEKDFYKILGLTEEDKKLPKDKFEDKLKKIYRQLSKEHHPDRYTNATDDVRKMHEEKFKEISEAYSVLSDPNKRQEYDMMGMGGFRHGFDPFGRGFNPFGSGYSDFGFGESQVKIGSAIKVSVAVTLEDVLNGSIKTISFKRKVYCDKCHREVCSKCRGTGVVKNVSRSGFTTFVQEVTCPLCHGTGYVVSGHCSNCGGEGYTIQTVTETITVPKGVDDGMMVSVNGLGNDYLGYGMGMRGDLMIRFDVKPHERFERYGDTLTCDLPLTLEEAFNGCEAEVKTLSGSILKINIPPLTHSGKQFRIAGKGLPNVNNNLIFGPLICVVDYIVPTKPLTKKQKELLKEFYKIEKEKGT